MPHSRIRLSGFTHTVGLGWRDRVQRVLQRASWNPAHLEAGQSLCILKAGWEPAGKVADPGTSTLGHCHKGWETLV